MPVINWNAVLAALIYGALTGLFNLAFAHKSQVESWVNEHPRLAALLKFTRGAGLDPWNVYSAAMLFIEKRLPLAQQNGAKAVAKFKADSIAPPPPPPPPAAADTRSPWSRPAGGLVFLLVVCCTCNSSACSLFGSSSSFWPKVEQCAPSPATLVSQATAILIAGGDYEQALRDLAIQETAVAVECAVKTAVQELLQKVGTSAENDSATARGKAFMAKHGVPQ